MGRWAQGLGLALVGFLLAGCERPSPESVQSGYRGTGMVQVYNARLLEVKTEKNQPPVAIPSPGSDGPKAAQAYKNVKVLGHLSVGEFNRLMVSMSSWVAPNEGCAYCHALPNFEDDSKYTKVVARRMIQMTQHINADWQPHVAQTGVTCYTCHRGEPVPNAIWFKSDPQPQGSNFIGDKAGQNTPSPVVNLSSLPNDPFTPFLLGAAVWQPPVDQASRVDLWADDAHVDLAGCELHVLPQHAIVSELGKQPTSAHDGLARYPHGA
jgi:photosynthetic reaction center cytochrome c subunit